MSLLLKIITPDKTVFSQEVDSVTVPGVEGEMGILTAHAPLVSALKPGELAWSKGAHQEFLAVGDGFVQVSGTQVSVLTDMALADAEIDEKYVTAALASAQAALANKTDDMNNEETALVQLAIQKSMAQLALKKRRHA